jgi:uncharacterized protein (UPF0218 family)
MSLSKTLFLPDSLREQLKQPLGKLVTGSVSDCNTAIKTAMHEEVLSKLVLVGDTVSRHAVEADIHADLIIVDNKEMRRSSIPVSLGPRKTFKLINPQGTIAGASWEVIAQALRIGNSAVIVEGEEDLLVLVAVSVAPFRSLVVYGQPSVGIVLVRVSAEKKREVVQVLEQMKEVTSV